MKIQSYFLLICSAILFLTSCNKDEGIGGSSSLEGYVYQVRHWTHDANVIIDTIPAVEMRVYLTFGEDIDRFYGKDIRTNHNGLYRFDFLRTGRYGVTAYSELRDNQLVPVHTITSVKGSLSKADTIFVTSSVSRGFSSIQGKVVVEFFENGRKIDEGLSELRAYISREGTYFNDVRIDNSGVFSFGEVLPGKYKVWLWSEDLRVRDLLTAVAQEIEVGTENRMYKFEQDFYVRIAR